jgi:hypothetical protein
MTLPSFLLCGTQKAGTTALYDALVSHPDVCMSQPKETEFFNWRYRRGWEWFATHFDHYDGERVVGEASTRTMATPLAPERISERLPDVKLVFLLRNPIERAYSAFWYYLAQGILCPNDDFSSFIRTEGHPLRQEIIHYGRYDEHLDRFLTTFERSQMLILFHEDLVSNPTRQLQRLFSFLNIDPDSVPNQPMDRKNVTRYPSSSGLYAWAKSVWKPVRSVLDDWIPSLVDSLQRTGKAALLQTDRPPLTDADRAYLQRLYAPTVEALQTRHDLDLSRWQ